MEKLYTACSVFSCLTAFINLIRVLPNGSLIMSVAAAMIDINNRATFIEYYNVNEIPSSNMMSFSE